MPKFQNTVRMLAASCWPERSASTRPRSDLGSSGSSWAAAGGASARTSRAAIPGVVRRMGSLRAPQAQSDLDAPRRVVAGGVDERGVVLVRKARVVWAARGVEHEPVVEARVGDVEDARESGGGQAQH